MPICDNCGTGLPVGYEYCFKCGYPVRGLPAADQTSAAPGAAAQQPPPGFPPPAGFAPPGFGAAPGSPGFGATPGSSGMGGFASAPAAARAQVLAGWNVRLVASLIDYMLVSLVLGFGAFFWFASMWGGSQNVLSHLVGSGPARRRCSSSRRC